MALPAEKADLRRYMRELRHELAARNPDAAETLAGLFPMKLLERYGPTVAGYVPIGSEMDPRPLMTRLEKAGAQLCLPRIDDDRVGMSFRLWSGGEPLEDGAFGLKEPHDEAPVAVPTLVLTPLLAFDERGHRLGYGKGHYDRALDRLRERGPVFVCGVAYRRQLIDTVPSEPHDQVLDWAITEEGSVPLFMMRGLRTRDDADATPEDEGPGAA